MSPPAHALRSSNGCTRCAATPRRSAACPTCTASASALDAAGLAELVDGPRHLEPRRRGRARHVRVLPDGVDRRRHPPQRPPRRRVRRPPALEHRRGLPARRPPSHRHHRAARAAPGRRTRAPRRRRAARPGHACQAGGSEEEPAPAGARDVQRRAGGHDLDQAVLGDVAARRQPGAAERPAVLRRRHLRRGKPGPARRSDPRDRPRPPARRRRRREAAPADRLLLRAGDRQRRRRRRPAPSPPPAATSSRSSTSSSSWSSRGCSNGTTAAPTSA